MHFLRTTLARALLTGLLLGIGFVVPLLWPLVIVGFVPLFLVLDDVKISWRDAVLVSIVAGFVLYGMAFSGLFTALPLDWLGVPTMPGIFLVSTIWILTTAIYTLAFVFFGLTLQQTRLLRHPISLVLIPFGWIACEWFGSLLFSIVNYGPGAHIGVHMSFNFLGNVFANDVALLQLASIGGVYLLSAAVMFSNLVVWHMITGNHRVKLGAFMLLAAGVCAWGGGQLFFIQNGLHSSPGSTLSVAVMSVPDMNRSPSKRPDFSSVRDTLIMKYHGVVDVIVFPEGLGTFDPTPQFFAAMSTSSAESVRLSQATIVGSGLYRGDDGITSTLAYTARGQSPQYTHKYFLMPIGEYMPVLYQLVLSSIGHGFDAQAVQKLRGYTSMTPSGPAFVHGARISALFCNEVMSPSLYRDQVRQGAQVLINVSSQGWFHGSTLIAQQMENLAKVRAVESRRWYVQSSYESPAFVLDAYGREVERTVATTTSSVVVVPVRPLDGQTLYTTF